MAVREVIYFPFGAQLSMFLQWTALLLPEPVAQSPPYARSISSAGTKFVVRVAVRVCAKTELLNRGVRTMKGDLRAELVLLNRNADGMIRLVQRATDARIWTAREAIRHVARLELLARN